MIRQVEKSLGNLRRRKGALDADVDTREEEEEKEGEGREKEVATTAGTFTLKHIQPCQCVWGAKKKRGTRTITANKTWGFIRDWDKPKRTRGRRAVV